MKVQGMGFSYFLDGKELKNFDTFEKRIMLLDVTIEVTNLRIDARTK